MNKFSTFAFSGFAVLGSLLLTAPAGAVDLDVTAEVAESCVIVTSPVAFGAYDPLVGNASTPLDAEGSVTVSCTSGSLAHILLDQGTFGASGTDAAPVREMANADDDRLTYNLYTDAGRADLWGNTELTGVDQLGTGAAGTPVVVYGRVGMGQNVPAGDYADVVDATVTF